MIFVAVISRFVVLIRAKCPKLTKPLGNNKTTIHLIDSRNSKLKKRLNLKTHFGIRIVQQQPLRYVSCLTNDRHACISYKKIPSKFTDHNFVFLSYFRNNVLHHDKNELSIFNRVLMKNKKKTVIAVRIHYANKR